MNTEIATIVSSVTTGARNIYEIATQMVNNRKTNKLINEGELKLLEVAIQKTIECAKVTSRHEIATEVQKIFWIHIIGYANTILTVPLV